MKSLRRLVMLVPMQARTRVNVRLLPATAAVLLLAACSTPTLRRSVIVQTRPDGVPVHASGRLHADTYVVARGDTLYSIAFRVGQDYRDLARWNGIHAPYTITPGQRLRVVPPAHTRTVAERSAAARAAQAAVPHPHPARRTAEIAAAGSAAAGAAGRVAASHAHTPASSQVASRHAGDAGSREVAGVDWRWPAPGKVLQGYRAGDAIPGVLIAGSMGEPVHAAADGVVVYSGNGLVGYGELIIIKHSDAYLSAYGHNRTRLVHEGEHVKAGQVIAKMGSSGAPRVELEFQIRHNGKPVDPLHYLPGR